MEREIERKREKNAQAPSPQTKLWIVCNSWRVHTVHCKVSGCIRVNTHCGWIISLWQCHLRRQRFIDIVLYLRYVCYLITCIGMHILLVFLFICCCCCCCSGSSCIFSAFDCDNWGGCDRGRECRGLQCKNGWRSKKLWLSQDPSPLSECPFSQKR